MTEVHSCGSPPFSTCLGAVASFIISQGVSAIGRLTNKDILEEEKSQ